VAPSSTAADRARRLLALLPQLHAGETLSVEALARTLGATPVEVAADLSTLSMCGLPPFSPLELVDVYVEGDAAEVFGDPPALTRPVRLTAEESTALAAALDACGRGPDDPLSAKLLAAAVADTGTGLASAVRAAVAGGDSGEVHAAVAAAVTRHEVLRIRYQGSGTAEPSEREIEPWMLGNERGIWYVSAHCRRADAERTFRLDRMVSAEPTGEFFAPPATLTPPQPTFARAAADLPRARVRFVPGSRDVTEREWPGATFREEAGGAVTAEIPYSSAEWVARRVVARLGDAEVVSPPEVRRAVIHLASRTRERS
jgi:proteasome accessory factor C